MSPSYPLESCRNAKAAERRATDLMYERNQTLIATQAQVATLEANLTKSNADASALQQQLDKTKLELAAAVKVCSFIVIFDRRSAQEGGRRKADTNKLSPPSVAPK